MPSTSLSMESFRKEYIWGFTQGNPLRYAGDKDTFFKLVKPLIGESAAVTIGASFHPYHLVNEKGFDIWEIVYAVTRTNNFCDLETLIDEGDVFHMVPPGPENFPLHVWPGARLSFDAHPEFVKYVPFVIPYLVADHGQKFPWQSRIAAQMEAIGNANAFLEETNADLEFLLPKPAFALGFGVFDKSTPDSLVDHFVDFANENLQDSRTGDFSN